MKLVLAMLAAFVTASTSQATTNAQYAAEVGVQSIVRAVVSKNLVDSAAKKVLLLTLETGIAKLGQMSCDRATGKDICTIDVTVIDDRDASGAMDTKYELLVDVYQGDVVSATWSTR